MIASSPRKPWTGQRVARLGFLIGLGWSAEKIAKDPLIVSTPGNVHRQAQRFSLSFMDAKRATPQAFVQAAAKRKITIGGLTDALLFEIASEPCLIDNILDDGIGA